MPRSLVELDERECRRLLSCHHFGRIAVVADGELVLVPLHYSFEGEHLVYCTGVGTVVDPGTEVVPVAFEIDHADTLYHDGWSVLVQGAAARAATDARVVTTAPVRPWIDRARPCLVRIAVTRISGRRIGP